MLFSSWNAFWYFKLLLTFVSLGIAPAVREKPLQPQIMGPNTGMILFEEIFGNITPKSISNSGSGRFFAQNMMYRHSITVYDRNRNLLKTIPDEVSLASYGYNRFPEKAKYHGAPVECAFSHRGQYAWVTNYEMTGPGLQNPGNDQCQRNQPFDSSFVYKINVQTFEIEKVIQVGCVPKYVAATPDNRFVLVSNWCSGDLSVIDTRLDVQVRRLYLGNYPRGIVVDSESKYAYVALMGETRIAKVRLSDFSVSYLEQIGVTPRHLCINTAANCLYISLSRPGQVMKLDLVNPSKRQVINTGAETRSMVLDPNENYLYAVSYGENSLSKIRVHDMSLVGKVTTGASPIGVTFDKYTQMVWVACYSGKIQLFKDWDYPPYAGQDPSNYPYVVQPQAQPETSAPVKPSYSIPVPTGLSPSPEPMVLRPTGSSKVLDEEEVLPPSLLPSTSPSLASHPAAPEAPINLPRQSSQGNLGVVAGSFTIEDYALRMVAQLKEKGFEGAQVLKEENGSFRVIAGRYTQRDEAQQVAEWLKQKLQPGAWIVEL